MMTRRTWKKSGGLWLAVALLLLGGCAGRSRVVLVRTPDQARQAADLTAREWGYRYLRETDKGVVYQSAGLAGPSEEQLRLRLEPIERGEVRVTVRFTGPTAGAEKFFLSDMQKNISYGTILPVIPAR